jgi:hypothetical protein
VTLGPGTDRAGAFSEHQKPGAASLPRPVFNGQSKKRPVAAFDQAATGRRTSAWCGSAIGAR